MTNRERRSLHIALGLLLFALMLSRTNVLVDQVVRNVGMTLVAHALQISSTPPQHPTTMLDRLGASEHWLGRGRSRSDSIAHLGLGWIWDARGNLGRASIEWQQAGLSAETFFERGDEALEVHRFEEAAADYERALAMNPYYVSAYYYRHHLVMAGMDREGEALSALRAAMAEDKGWLSRKGRLRAWISWGLWLYSEKQYSQAESALRKAVDIASDPSHTVSRSLLSKAYYWLGRALSKQKRFQEAFLTYQLAISSDPTNVDAYMHYGLAAWYTGRLDESAGALQKAIQLSPQRPWSYVWLASVLYDRGRDIEKADQILAVAVKLGAEDPAVLESVIRFWKDRARDEERMSAYCERIRHISDPAVYSSIRALCEN